MKLVVENRLLAGICLLISLGFMACSQAHGHHSDTEKANTPANKFDWQPIQYDSTKKYIYLSFDDGPQHGTVTCYELCKTENIKASFFMVGVHTARKSDGQKIVSMIRESYPQVLLANHSYTHAYNKYQSFYTHPHAAEQDFLQAQDFLHIPYKIARLPGNRAWVREGDIKTNSLTAPVTHLLDSAGYNVIGWDVEWRFGRKTARPLQSAEKMAAEVDSAFARSQTHERNHVVVLTHDRMFQHPSDADSLAKFIHILKQNPQYVFETVDHYPGLKRPVHKGE
jgi:peptidoglycan/xylan/chitin deacetylase (PgdA/CDA1 family)